METRKIYATPGKALFNGVAYSLEVYLGVNDQPSNWLEVPIEQMEEYYKSQEVAENVLFE